MPFIHSFNFKGKTFWNELLLLITYSFFPYVCVFSSWPVFFAHMIVFSACQYIEFHYNPNFAKNIRIMEINKIKDRLLPGLIGTDISVYVIGCWFMNKIVPRDGVSWGELTPINIILGLSILFFGDIAYAVSHRFYLHGDADKTGNIHKLHHCCRNYSGLNLFVFEAWDATLEFGIAFYLPSALAGIFVGPTMGFIVSTFILINFLINHSSLCETNHSLHHKLVKGNYNFLFFPDIIGLMFPDDGDTVYRNLKEVNE